MLSGIRIGREARAHLLFLTWVVALGPVVYVSAVTKAADHYAAGATPWQHYAMALLHFLGWSVFVGCALHWYRRRPPAVRRRARYAGLALFAAASLSVWGLDLPFTHWLDDALILGVLLLIERMYHQLVTTRIEAERHELENERARRAALEARWASLESRVRPHFLFNTLSSIRELMHRDVGQADAMIQRFAELLRFSLDSGRDGAVPLEQEMRVVAGYLEIERMRLGARLSWEIDVPSDCRASAAPALAVLTLVENAVKHAVAPRPKGGRVTVRARSSNGALEIEVADDGPGFGPCGVPAGHGLDLLLERLKTWEGGEGQLLIRRGDPGAVVTLSIPRPVSA
jgi:signal transduction histidine kinase